ncbi:hypothetical protein OA046_01090 [Candidatus Pelagibacter sp.]|nr:hypothetical protein [Candidatus Pelagibacter sp.]
MKIFDCTTYYDEELILDLRFNMLNKYIDKFIICEAKFSHSGRKKKLNFDINKFSKFKDKIVYIVLENEPENLIYEDPKKKIESQLQWRSNSVKRISFQRNKLLEAVNDIAQPNDYVLYSDNDEIPDLSLFDPYRQKNKIVIFEQDLFYYKFNLLCNRIKWYGTRAIKKKDLKNFEWLRQIKPKKYPFYRLDTLLKKDRYMNINIIKNGGWHFTRIISPEKIHTKELDTEHHDEYRASNKTPEKIKDLIKRRVIDHDHLADSREYKFGKEFPLIQLDISKMPKYIREKQNEYSGWLDLN